MNRRRLGLLALALAASMVSLLLMFRPGRSTSPVVPHTEPRDLTLSQGPAKLLLKTSGPAPRSFGPLPPRALPPIVGRNEGRSGLAWVLRQLGADDALLDRFVDGDLVAVLSDLKRRALAGDASAINILGFVAYQKCHLSRSAEGLREWEAYEARQAASLPAADAAWFNSALRQVDVTEERFIAACEQVIDQDQVATWLDARATAGDGASLWVLSRMTVAGTEGIQYLRASAAAGFPQGQFELAWAIRSGQEGAAGDGPNKVSAVDLLRRSAARIPAAEADLAFCEYDGCDGAAPDIEAAVTHARHAAQRGVMDALSLLAPHIATGQLDPNEVRAWELVHATLQQLGCSVGSFSVAWMKSTSATLSAPDTSERAHTMANELWSQFGGQIMAEEGCQL